MSTVEIVTIAIIAAPMLVMPARAQQPTATRESVIVSGTVERAERSTRTLTVRTSPSTTQVITVPAELKLFDELRTGDRVTVRVHEEVIVAVRPGARPSLPVDTTATAASRNRSGNSEMLEQLKAVVTIESVDRGKNVVVYRTEDNRRVTRVVVEPRLLDGLKPGDIVEVTYTRERAVDLQRGR